MMRIRLHRWGGALFAFIFVLLLLPALRASWAAQDTATKEVEGYGEAELTDDLTPAQAKAAALNRALVNALEIAVGVNLHSNSVVFNGDLVSDLVRSASSGVIVSRKIMEAPPEVRDKRITYKVRVKASVKQLNIEKRGNFKVDASVSRVDKAPGSSGSQVFQHDDEIQVRVKANKDAHLYIFGVDQNLNITKLYPNDYVKDEVVPSGKEFVFPSGSLRERGIRLRVKAPKVAQRSTESVLVVATTEKISLLTGGSSETPTVTDLMREISEIDPGSWSEKTVGYEIRR